LIEDASRQENDKDFNIKVFDVNASICELLLWVNANDEWQCKNNNVEYAKYRKKGQPGANSILGLKHAYNASKHEMSYVHLFTFEKKKSFMGSPTLLIADPTSEPVWVNCPDDPDTNRKNQVENYREFLKDRKVIPTFDEAITLLNMMNRKVQFKEK
jgi:hypothetical protein